MAGNATRCGSAASLKAEPQNMHSQSETRNEIISKSLPNSEDYTLREDDLKA